jgi:quinoprotein glucose dehydrogenase
MTQAVRWTIAFLLAAGINTSAQSPREWRDYAGGPDSSRFVAARQLTSSNVSQLQVVWTYPGGQTDFNPLVVRGVVYGRGPKGTFVAIDAATGKEIWVHEGAQGFNGRGVNYWESADGTDRRLLYSAGNFLYAINAANGQTITTFGVDGRVDLRVGLDRDPDTINAGSRIPGRVFENLIIMGSATNQEYASAPGDIRAFNVMTGEKVWQFHTVPRPGEYGYRGRGQQLVGAVDRRHPRHRLHPHRQPEVQLLRRQSTRRQPVRRLPGGA